MIVIRYTGRGWLAFVLFMVVGVACLMLASAFGLRDDAFAVGAWAIGIGGLAGLIAYARLARRHGDARHPPAKAPGVGGSAATRRQLAAANGWRYREYAPELRARWQHGYAVDVERIAPGRVLAGQCDGLPFTVFDTGENIGSLADYHESLRTVCMVHLPVALPDVRLRGRLPDEDRCPDLPPVATEPPWNCDILPRMSALALIESGGLSSDLAAESDVPGFADALVTADVRWETLLRKIPGWRVHGRDLVFAAIPGGQASLSAREAMGVVAGLVAIAKTFPADAMQRYGQRPVTGLPLDDSETAGRA